MTQLSNDKRKINNCLDPTGISGHLKAVNPSEKPAESDDLPSTSPDDIPFTLKELVLGLWDELETKLETDSLDEKLETEHLLEIVPVIPEFEKLRKQLHLELRRQPRTLADVVMKFLKSPPAIAESLQSIDSGRVDYYTDQIDKIIELWQETNRHLGNIAKHLEEPPEDTPQASRPFKPPPTGRGGSKPRREVSPGLKRLRQIEKGGEQP